MKKKLDKIGWGALFGLIAIVLGMFILMLTRTGFGGYHTQVFFSQFVENADFRQNVLLFSIFPNPILFFVFSRLKMNNTANGVVGVSMILAIYIIAIAVL